MDLEGRLDSVDWVLLVELQRNARMSYSELGRRVGMTPPAVIERVRRMEEAGIITGYHVEIDLGKVGRQMVAIIRLAGTHGGCVDARGCSLDSLLKQTPEILRCDRVTGDDCYVLRVAVSSTQQLETLLERLAPHGRTTTCMVLSTPVASRMVEPPGSPGGRAVTPASPDLS